MGEKGCANVAVAAISVKAKLAGLWLDKTALTGLGAVICTSRTSTTLADF